MASCLEGHGLSQRFLGGTQQDPGGKQARDEMTRDVDMWLWNGYPQMVILSTIQSDHDVMIYGQSWILFNILVFWRKSIVHKTQIIQYHNAK